MEDFARKMKDLLRHLETVEPADVELLKVGRHFRLSPGAMLAVGKDDRENQLLLAMARSEDAILETADLPGPVGLVRGRAAEEELMIACALVGRYVGKAKGQTLFSIRRGMAGEERRAKVEPLTPLAAERYRI